MSENSSARTSVMAPDSADTTSGIFSVIPPGCIPVPCNVTPAARHSSSYRCRSARRGWNQPRGVTMFLPERRIARTVSVSAMKGL